MRIVHAVNWSRLARDAAIEQAVHTAAALARQGAEVTVMMPRTARDPEIHAGDFAGLLGTPAPFAIEQVRTAAPGPLWLSPPAWLLRCHQALCTRRADVVVSRMPVSLLAGAGPGRRWLYDQYRPAGTPNPLVRRLVRRATSSPLCMGLALHSHYAARSFLELGVEPGKVLVAHNGVDPCLLAARPDPARARLRFDLPPGKPVTVYAGRLVQSKGIDSLLAIAAARPGMLLVLAGSLEQGPVEAAARALPNVRVLPWLEPAELRELLAAADVLAVPPSSRALAAGRTVLPIKLYSYLAAGRPILAPDLPDTEGLLTQGETALLVPPDDTPAALDALDRLLSEPALAARLGAAARRLAEEKTWDTRARLILDHIEQRLAPAGRWGLSS